MARTRRMIVLGLLVMSWNPLWAADFLSMSGEELYRRFCAACHGIEGRGDGPVASYFTVEVPDLTLIARRARGTFPRERVARIIDGRHIIGAHGTRTMPVWGEDFTRAELGNPDADEATELLIERLVEYVSQIQRPAL
ncbi:MAG: cytochrome c [Xanthomonadaceae bacterium]|nr:cytochrome c [Xanthomonadaceae bacterium]